MSRHTLALPICLSKDYFFLKKAGVSAIFGPDTNIPQAATEILSLIKKKAAGGVRGVSRSANHASSGRRRIILRSGNRHCYYQE